MYYERGIKCKRYIKQIFGKKELELELREKELELIFGWAKELELIFQPKKELEYIERNLLHHCLCHTVIAVDSSKVMITIVLDYL